MSWRRGGLLLVAGWSASGCITVPPPPYDQADATDGVPDAPSDGPRDAPFDAPVDGAIDAPIDAQIDAQVDAATDANTTIGLVSWFRCDDDASDGVDDSVPGRSDARCSSSRCPSMTGGRHGSAAYAFSNDLITAADPAGDALPFTVALWLRPDADSSARFMSKQYNFSTQWYLQRNSDDGVTFTLWGLDGPAATIGSAAGSVPLAAWTHVAASWDGATMRLFLQGSVVASTAQSTMRFSSSEDLTLGAGISDFGLQSPLTGALDDVRIYDRALSEDELRAIIAEANSTP